jgi:hypothetical protein
MRSAFSAAMTVMFAAFLAAGAGGCATYEYNLVQPADLARHIGRKTDETVKIDPLEYRLRTVENRLVVRIFNPTEEQIELIGPRSTAVDPTGQSRPLRGQTIAPGSFISLIFPPPRPVVWGPTPGPTWGVGVGGSVRVDGRRSFPAGAWSDPYAFGDPGPRFLAVIDANDNSFWEWQGTEGELRLLLTFQRKDKQFQHTLVFRRQKT